MIVTKIRGGLGNQLFAYAAGRSLALTNDSELVLDISWYASGGRPFLLDRFNIEGAVSTRDHSGADDGIGFNQEGWSYDPSFEVVNGDRFLSGRWQSERFFAPHADAIRSDLTLADPSVEIEAQRYVEAKRGAADSVVAVHCRRGDYVSLADQGRFRLLGLDYFRSAMALFDERTQFLLFSDDPTWSHQHLGGPTVTVADLEESIMAFTAMRRCDHYIISNSTFSWWAAWLSDRAGTKVLAPPHDRWFGPELAKRDTSDVIPARWSQVPYVEEPDPRGSRLPGGKR